MTYNNTAELMKQIRAIMKDEHITINELSLRLNKSQPATSGLFRMKNISCDTLKEIAEAIEYNLEIDFVKKSDSE